MNPGDAYLALLVLILLMIGSIALFTTMHRPRRMRSTDSPIPSRLAPPMPNVADRAARDRAMQLERIMVTDTAVSFEVAQLVWGGAPMAPFDDDHRAAFFAVWAGVRREMAEAILKEIENGN